MKSQLDLFASVELPDDLDAFGSLFITLSSQLFVPREGQHTRQYRLRCGERCARIKRDANKLSPIHITGALCFDR